MKSHKHKTANNENTVQIQMKRFCFRLCRFNSTSIEMVCIAWIHAEVIDTK